MTRQPDRGSWAEETADELMRTMDLPLDRAPSGEEIKAARNRVYIYLTGNRLTHFADWTPQLHLMHCRDDRCNGGLTCSCPCHSGWTSNIAVLESEVLPAHFHGGNDELYCPSDCPRLKAVEHILEDRALLPLVNQIRNRARRESQRLATTVRKDDGSDPVTITIQVSR